MVGESKTTNGTHEVKFEPDGTITDLGTLGGDASVDTDVNENGDIVGAAQNSSGFWRAFVIPAGGSMKDLGALGGDESRARAINRQGEVVGSAMTTNGQWHAFIYSEGKMEDLGAMGASSHAFDINDSGTIVGTALQDNGLNQAFVRYPGGPVLRLADLVSIPEGNWLAEARAINNAGFIATMEFQPVSHTGVNFVTVLQLGAVVGQANEGNWEVTASVPPGNDLKLEASIDLVTWSTVATVQGGNTITHRESMLAQPKFMRAVLQ
jgi:probable HAF family extracellular repeat protein